MTRAPMLALRSLRARPTRTILTTFGVVLGVAVILAISITNLSTLDAITTVFGEASGKAHLIVRSSDTSGKGFPEDILRRIETTPGVEVAVPTLHAMTQLSDEASPGQLGISMLGAVGGGLTIYGVNPSLDTKAREYRIVEGQFLPAERDAYDIVLVKNYADDKKIRIGNDVELVTPDGQTARLRVLGLMSKEGPGQLNNGAFGVIPIGAAQEIFSRAGELDQVDIVATPEAASSAALDELKAALQARLGRKYLVIYPETQGERVARMLEGYQMGLGMFSAIALFVGAFLVYNAFSMTVVERTREIGMLRTLGMTRRQTLRQILTEAGILGVVGSALGIAAGILLARGLIKIMELAVAQEVKRISVPPIGIVTSLLVGIMVTLAAAAIPALQASRVSPLEALRVRGKTKEGWFVRQGWIIGVVLLVVSFLVFALVRLPPPIDNMIRNTVVLTLLLGGTMLVPVTVNAWERVARPLFRSTLGSEGQLGSRNVQRAKLRTTLTVAALMVGVAMILSIRAVTAAFGEDIGSWIEKYIGGDLFVHSSLLMRADLEQQLASVDGVAAVTPVRYLDVKRVKPEGGTENLTFMALDPATYRRVTSFVFVSEKEESDRMIDRLESGDAVFVSSVLSEKYGLKPGDLVRLATRRGQRDFEVAGVVVDFYNQGLVVQGSWKDMRRYFGLNDVSAFFLKIQPNRSVSEIRDRIDQLYGKSQHLRVESNEAIRSRALGLIAQTRALFDVLALIAMVVAALGVVNTLTMNVLERTQEIGMLRSLGMTRRQISKMILAEAGMMGLVGGVFGLVFGIVMSRTVLSSINSVAGFKLTYVLPVQGILVSLLIALVVTQIAALWPARRAARTRIIEAVQFE